MVRVGIIGGGLAGLSCAYSLNKNNINVKVFEKEKNVGGRIRCIKIDNNLVHLGAYYYTTFYRTFIELMKELGIHSQVVNISPKEYAFLIGGKPFNFTARDFIFNKSIPFKEKINLVRMAIFAKLYISKLVKLLVKYEHREDLELRPLFKQFIDKHAKNLDNISLAEFIEKKYSKWILDNIVEPITLGTLLCSSRDVAAYYGLGPLVLISYTPKHLPGGIDVLSKRIYNKLHKKILCEAMIKSVKKEKDHFIVEYNRFGKNYREIFDYVVIATPLNVTSHIFPKLNNTMVYGSNYQIYVKGKLINDLKKRIVMVSDEKAKIAAIVRFGGIYCIYSNSKNPKIGNYFKRYKIVGKWAWREGYPTIKPWQRIPSLRTKFKNLYVCGDFYYFPSMETAAITGKKVAEDIIKKIPI